MSASEEEILGFNNLTKSLSFNIYDICYTESSAAAEEYLQYIHNRYKADNLKEILCDLTQIIGATVLNISTQDFDPLGASAAILISEEALRDHQLMHLDKSHCSVHTYPETNQDNGVSSFRVDIDVSTCGKVSPLSALDFLIGSFESDVVNIDYKIRGFTRNKTGKKIFKDHVINSITDYIKSETLEKYHSFDVNIPHENIFHSKMKLKTFDLDDYLFDKEKAFTKRHQEEVKNLIWNEIEEIFNCKNL